MHAVPVLQTLLAPVFGSVDRRNASNLVSAVCACLAGRRLTLMELARQWPGALRVAAPLKRLDRLLSNRQMQAERLRIYGYAAAWVVRHAHPVVLVDWSELTRDRRWQLLRASVALKGRSLTVYEEVHPQSRLNASRVQRAFLQRLHAILGRHCRPVIVTDAGFKTPWFRDVQALQWAWLGRVRGHVQVRRRDASQALTPFLPVQRLFAGATAQPQALGWHELTAKNALVCWLVRVKRQAKGRHEWRQRDRQRAGGGTATQMARRQSEPWILACSPGLADYRPRQLARLYGLRMQIEAAFRDLKSHQFGCGFADTQTRKGPRLALLLTIHMLATLVAWLAGIATVTQHETRFRLSLLRRGWECLRQYPHPLPRQQKPPWKTLQSMVARHA